MKLQEITANIRLRSPWEAIDLGFAMVQSWWKSIYIPLAILTFSIAFILYLIVPKDNFWLTGIIFWWLKPLYDRLVLHIISHKLFNDELSSWQALKALPSLIWNTGFFQSMTFRRLSLSRGFNLPIWQLEQLRGKQRSTRQSLLHLASHSHAVWLTIVLVHLEFFLVLSLFAILAMFLPENIQRDFFDGLFNNKVEYKTWIDFLNYGFYVLVITLIHPFYIAGSFALYINRRTQLESWDIELDFKKIGMRLTELTKHALPTLLVISLSLGSILSSTPSIADELILTTSEKLSPDKNEFLAQTRKPANTSKNVIKAVMLTNNLDDKKIVKRWIKKKTPKKDKKENNSFKEIIENILAPIAKFIGLILEFGLWILLATGIGLLIYFRDRWLHLFYGGKKHKKVYQSPEVMFGMDIRPESLPNDIAGEAQKLWQQGKHREALSLLYRGALVLLINQENVQLEDSYTEGDVLKHSAKRLTEIKQKYLQLLTTQWKQIAYAHRPPTELDIQHLFDNWNSHFASAVNQGEKNE